MPRSDSGGGGEPRGFALFVGLSERTAEQNGVEIADVVTALRDEVGRRVPLAESHALVVSAPSADPASDLAAVITGSERAAETRAPDPAPGSAVVIDLARHRVLIDERDVHLTYKEFALLQEIVVADGVALSRDRLRRVIATSADSAVNARTIDVHIRRLRVKLRAHADLIHTVHGSGYRFDRGPSVSVVRGGTPSPDLF
ncbi:MAG: response regulator consisting of a CheY-like receiver domain and a winged-helix DNA-binding domain [Microbacteriaceae bacterium]|nr:response regulator consisting of a CheY-like receiver domain and a winged-helix DNA-binding domain [Microbacteriaceae bacterium]